MLLGRERRAEFLLGLRARGIRDLDVLRALETVPRESFVPHRYADLANRDMALPIACGQTMPEPFLVARMVEALALKPGMRVLEIGAGSGYATAILARLSGEVLAIERFQSLALAAAARLEKLRIRNAGIVWGDGLALPPGNGPFDRVVVHALMDSVPDNVRQALAAGGMLMLAQTGGDGQQWLRRLVADGQGGFAVTPVCLSRMRPLIAGMSQGL